MCTRHDTPEIANVPPAGQYSRPLDHRCSSEIGNAPDANGRLPFTLKIKVFMSEPTERNPDGTTAFIDRVPTQIGFVYTRYNCQPMTEAVYTNAFNAMVDSVDTHWNDKLILTARRDDVQDLTCRIALERVQTAAESNLHITVIHQPHREWRDYCALGGSPTDRAIGEMVLAYPQPRAQDTGDQAALNLTYQRVPTNDRGTQPITQNVFCHELGHYLTLHHTCVHLAPDGNADVAYCTGRSFARQSFLMSYGNAMHRNYAREWRTRLERHHYHCERRFEPSVAT